MAPQDKPNADKMIFRGTNTHLGRHISVSPDNSTMRYLSYGRIILKGNQRAETFSTGDRETALICLSGEATVIVDGQANSLGRYDSIYIPRDSAVEVTTNTSVDLAEFSASVSKKYPATLVPYTEVKNNSGLNFKTGGPSSSRQVNMLLAKNIEAGRLVAGFTESEPGNWTSWPPHEHARMLEEMYVYFDMPDPAFGIQLVYNNTKYPELVTVVRDGDAVLMPSGFHPNVSVPGHRISFLWAMAAHREVEDRQFGVVNVQPGFDHEASGLEAGRNK